MGGLAVRKHRSLSGDKDGSNVNAKILGDIYGQKHAIPLDFEALTNHGVFNMAVLRGNLKFEVTLAPKEDIVVTADATKDFSYELKNIQLEYKSLRSSSLYEKSLMAYNVGKSFLYEEVKLDKTERFVDKDTSLLRFHINAPRKSLIGVLFLFRKVYAAGTMDSQKYEYPNITEVNVGIDGVPNKLFSQGMTPPDFFETTCNRYNKHCREEYENIGLLLANFVSFASRFYKEEFSLWIDFRGFPDNNIHGGGVEINNTRDGVKLEVKRKKGSSNTAYDCFMYLVSDASFDVQKGSLKQVVY